MSGQTTRKNGFYWTRGRDPKYPGVSISEWSENFWFHAGVSGATKDSDVEVLSSRLPEPRRTRTGRPVTSTDTWRPISDAIAAIYSRVVASGPSEECDMVWPDAATRAAMREVREAEAQAEAAE